VADLNPATGREQAMVRPVLVVSNNQFNAGPSGLVTIVPITGTDRHIPLHVRISPPEGGLTKPSIILCDQVRTISVKRLQKQLGAITPDTMAEIEDRIRILLDL
jgi:mRNA interferase MazF